MTLGQKLRDERKRRKMTQVQLVEWLRERGVEISQGMLSDYERDKKRPDDERLVELEDALGQPYELFRALRDRVTDHPSVRSSWNLQTLSDLLLRGGVNDLTPVAA